MFKIKPLLFCGLTLALAIFASRAFAASSDFKIQTEIDMGATIDSLVVSNDRFVITLSKTGRSLTFLDTWDWSIDGAVTLGNTVDTMAISPSGTRPYFSTTAKKIAWMDISSLSSTPFDGLIRTDSFSLSPVTNGVSYGSTGISEIDVIQTLDNPDVDCVFLKLKSLSNTYNLASSIIKNGTALTNNNTWYGPNISNLQISAAQTRLFTINTTKVISTNSTLDGYQCTSNQLGYAAIIASQGMLSLLNPNQFLGVGVDQTGAQLVVGETVSKSLQLYQITNPVGQPLTALPLVDSYTVKNTPTPIWVKDFATEPNPMVLFGQTAVNLYILPMIQYGFTSGKPDPIHTFTSSPLLLANSSTTDGYLYVAQNSGNSFSLLTANPWVYDLGTTAPTPVCGETFSIQFSYTNGGSYVIADCPNFAVNSSQCTKTVAQGSLSSSQTPIVINSSVVGGGDHILGVFVSDSRTPAHTGRSAIPISIALPPEINNYKLQFGNKRIMISFKTASVNASTVYTIYYGTNGNAPPDNPEQISATGGDGNPKAPIVINNPQANRDYSYTIENLTNDQTYYAQIVAVDNCGNKKVSDRKSTVPRLTFTLTDLVGETGGCGLGASGAGRAANAADLVLLACPLLILLILKIKIRSKR